ncbi:hypothetical protein GLA29479_4484 [Lysobacter antibioticus]|uniref:DUF2059 domain-containing protein n=1 Tax=Lysobacter antibioticus TaxID=84531 RepID=UPI00072168D4|nr:DUF2059 domain-containing protein [Lysobacter antibioticus]ALN65315.1 hypothetical protein GLA29479_4484 [Lysobacter antibioticus]
MSTLSRSLSILLLSTALCAAPAFAARPSDAQIDQLMHSMNYERMKGEMLKQMREPAEMMAMAEAGDGLSDKQREALARSLARQMSMVEEMLDWKAVAPIYRKVYGETFDAAEVQALIDFYGSPAGRSIMEKMPLAIGRTMQELQPLMKTMFERMQRELRDEVKDIVDGDGKTAPALYAPPAPPSPPQPATGG